MRRRRRPIFLGIPEVSLTLLPMQIMSDPINTLRNHLIATNRFSLPRRSLEARADTGAASYLVYGTSLETREDLYRRYRNASANAVFLQGSAEQPAAATTAIGSGAHRTYSSLAWAADPEAAAAAAAAAATATAAATAERPPQGRVRGEAVFAVDAGDLFETFCKPSGTYRVDLIVFNFPYAGESTLTLTPTHSYLPHSNLT